MEYPNGYSEAYGDTPWPHYGDPPVIDGTNIRPDVLTDRAALVALRGWVLQERDHALRITIGSGAASSLRFAIAMTDVAAVLCECIAALPPDLRVIRPTPFKRRPRVVPRLSSYGLPREIDADPEITDPALPILDQGRMHY
jgi:hypothetical protein